ncbi:YtrH family sporulation protein [Paenibacillus sp. IB182496]|uniref:YtrH family sporulation protein n=1 Tax=Paenibacillus sabuli TaxID=2772509 RepID=A0A927BYV4_9BACL|nr:YtrH family sporulation protein [Paenibacillus sabuli]MBD2848270.1 YtrH family sporulation protein [Paenibacillus sabuli]
MNYFLSKTMLDFFIAFGMVIGGAFLAGIGSVLVFQAPGPAMIDTADKLKIWAIVAAVGGTIDPMRVIETNMLEGHLSPVVQQICIILSAFLGAHMGTELIKLIGAEAL